MRVYVFEEDSSVLKLLILYLKNQGHQVQGFSNGYKCPLYLLEECQCPASKPCADAVLVNTRMPNDESIEILIDQERKGCKLPKANKAVMSASYSAEQEERISKHGFYVIKKPFRLSVITSWLKDCSTRLENLSWQ